MWKIHLSILTCRRIEPASQDILRHYIAEIPDLELAGVCDHALQANEMLSAGPVQLMFLDINMPRLSGINFYKSLTNPPDVIFTTAYPEYAIEGFEVNAIDYLVKSFPFERFLKAVNRLKDKLQGLPAAASGNYILLKADKKIYKVRLGEILFMEAMGDYVKVQLDDKMLIVHETLQSMESHLPGSLFIRVHKSYLVSLERLEHIDGNMAMVASRSIPIGLSYKSEFLKRIQKS